MPITLRPYSPHYCSTLWCRVLCVSLGCLLASWCSSVQAQVAQQPYLSWDDFVENYLQPSVTDDDETPHYTDEDIERLEQIYQHPYQVNRMTRTDLQQLPFLTTAQIDSLLAYRQHRPGLLGLGELQLISGWDYFTRAYFSLFVRCDSASLAAPKQEPLAPSSPSDPWTKVWFSGHHELDTRMDIPLYQRQGYRSTDAPTSTNHYEGSAWRHLFRYRYHYKQEVAYGLTLEKDGGEPIATSGFYPYDYLSAYVQWRPAQRPWSLIVGDYEVKGESGLLYGRSLFSSREQSLRSIRHRPYDFKPHTSTDEYAFFRGGAFAYQQGAWRAMSFVSFRTLDASRSSQGDTVYTILRTGLHRTPREIANRNTLNAVVAGSAVGWDGAKFGVSWNTVYNHYGLPVSPRPNYYNYNYFRGQSAFATSVGYHYSPAPQWVLKGEAAADQHFHFATIHSLTYQPSSRFSCQLQPRYYSTYFQSLYGYALQQGTHLNNEQGLLLGARYLPTSRWEWTAYADVARRPHPVYQAHGTNTFGLEAFVQTHYAFTARWSALVAYRLKTKECDVTGTNQLTFRHRNRLRLSATYATRRFQLHLQADGTYALRMTGTQSFGWMTSLRSQWAPTRRVTWKAFLAAFFTDDYESAVYAYTPRLYRSSASFTFAYHGLHLAQVVDWQVTSQFIVSVRQSSTYFTNRSVQSAGTEAIHSPWKNDLSVQLRYHF